MKDLDGQISHLTVGEVENNKPHTLFSFHLSVAHPVYYSFSVTCKQGAQACKQSSLGFGRNLLILSVFGGSFGGSFSSIDFSVVDDVLLHTFLDLGHFT